VRRELEGMTRARTVPANLGAQQTLVVVVDGSLRDQDMLDQLEVVFARHMLELQ